MNSSKNLICFMAHLDDFELSCLGYLFRHVNEYDKIRCIIATTWEAKTQIWHENLNRICQFIGKELRYENLGFQQRKMQTNFDDIKDKFYSTVDFKERFDILTHDFDDCHTDHIATHMIAKGLYKYCDRFTTVYSPSSVNFMANYWIGLGEDQHNLKRNFLDKYSINVEQSYTKLGYYLQDTQHYDVGSAYYRENFVHADHEHHECYKILKWK